MKEESKYPLDVELLEEIIDNLPIGAIVLDEDGVIQRFNRYEEQLSGLSREQTIGRSFFSDVAPCTKDIELGPRFHEGIAKGNLDIDVEFSFPYPYNRVPRDVRIRAVSVGGKGDDAHVVLIEDITSRKQLERNNADMMAGLRSMMAAERTQKDKRSSLTMGSRESFEVDAYVLYANIADYSNIAAKVPPSELFKVLDRRMRHAVEIVHRRGGEIDEISGDGLLAYFAEDEDNPERTAFDVARAGWSIAKAAADNDLELPFRVGVANGPIANGPIGRIEFGQRTSIGRPIVLSRSLAQVARPNELLISETFADALGESAAMEQLRGVTPSGIPEPGEIFRIVDLNLPMGA